MKSFIDFIIETKKADVPLADYTPSHGSHSKPKKKKKPIKEGFNDFAEYHDHRTENPNPHLGETIKDVHDKLNHSKEDWEKSLHPHEKEAVRSYTENSYTTNKNLINLAHGRKMSFVHEPEDSVVEKQDKDDDRKEFHVQTHGLDSLLDRSHAPHDVTVMHGISSSSSMEFHPGKAASKHPQRHVKFPSYLSTTIDPRTAHHFASPWRSKQDTHVLKIHVKKGQKGFKYVGTNSATDEDEAEAILHRNTTLKIGKKPKTLDHPSGNKVHVWDAHIVN
jgi:hypothetical protein